MAANKTTFVCASCGTATAKWTGKCTGCGEWNTVVEEVPQTIVGPGGGAVVPGAPRTPAVPISHIEADTFAALPTGLGEVDRVLSGGLLPGSATLLGGPPGVGKSTLLLQLAHEVAAAGRRVLYVSAEESQTQVRRRADRLGAVHDDLWLAAETDLLEVLAQVEDVQPELVVVDSVQTVTDPSMSSAAGSVGQVRQVASSLVRNAKTSGRAVILVGHVTKDGSLAGPRVLEHLVDTVLSFDGDTHHSLRLLRSVKHRFGSTDELGVFEMTGVGLAAVGDPSGLFLGDRQRGVAGSTVVATLEGQRPLLVEIQALVSASAIATPRRSTQGIDGGRLAMLLAVLGRRLAISVHKDDVYALAVGGARVHEPAADMAIVLAVLSSMRAAPVPSDIVACGEVGLGGEVRQVAGLDRRLAEAARLGFKRAVVPSSASGAISADGLQLIPATTIADLSALVPGDETFGRRAS